MDYSLETLVVLFFVALIAEIYGSIFGGGSFLTQPALLAAGVPPHMVIAQDVGSSTGTAITGAYVFRKNKYVLFDLVKWWLPGMILGPIIGVELLLFLSEEVVEKFILILCVAGACSLFFIKKDKQNTEQHLTKYWKVKSLLGGFLVGAYFGFSGAGAGTLTSLVLMSLFGLSMRHTLGTRKFIHLPIHLVSTAAYYYAGLIIWPVFLSMFAGCLVAGWVGSHIALKVPERILRPLFLSVIVILCLSLLFELK